MINLLGMFRTWSEWDPSWRVCGSESTALDSTVSGSCQLLLFSRTNHTGGFLVHSVNETDNIDGSCDDYSCTARACPWSGL